MRMAGVKEPLVPETPLADLPGVIPANEGVEEVRELRRLLNEGNMDEFRRKVVQITERVKDEVYFSILAE